jgi:acyl-CoA thioester hydrolase
VLCLWNTSDFVPSRNDNDQYSHLNNSIYNLLYDTIINKYLVEQCGLQPGGTSSTSPLDSETHLRRSLETRSPPGYNVGEVPSSVTPPKTQHKSGSLFSSPPVAHIEAEILPRPESEQHSCSVDVIGLVVSSWSTFHRPLSFPSRLLLGMRVTKLGRSSVSYEVGVFGPLLERLVGSELGVHRLQSDSVAAVGGFTHVFVDKEKRRPVKGWPRPLLEGLEAVLGSEGSLAKL